MISVLIPAYNASTCVEKAVASALAQNCDELEVVVVDDGSTDDTWERLQRLAADDGRVRLARHESNQGLLAARRTGVAEARGAYVCFLDADDQFERGYLEGLVRNLNEHVAVDILQTGITAVYHEEVSAEERRWNDDFLTPPDAEALGEEVIHVIFRDRKAPWAMWGKLISRELAQRAYDVIPKGHFVQAEDALTMFVTCAFAQSWRGVPQLRGYCYDIQGGSSHRFESICRSGDGVRVLDGLFDQGVLSPACRADRDRLVELLADETVWAMTLDGKVDELPARIEEALRHWNAPELMAALCRSELRAKDESATLREEAAAAQAEVARVSEDLRCVEGSVSFRTGRALTAPLRAVRGLVGGRGGSPSEKGELRAEPRRDGEGAREGTPEAPDTRADGGPDERVQDFVRFCASKHPLPLAAGTLSSKFDALLADAGVAHAVGMLAQACWDDDARLLEAVCTARSLRQAQAGEVGNRVAVFYHALGTGGAERVTLDLAQLWASMGKRVLVHCDQGGAAGYVCPKGVELCELPSSFECERERYETRAAALAKVLRAFDPDCLVYGAWLSHLLTWDLLVAKACHVPFVVFTHGTHRVLTGYGNPRALRMPDVYRHVDGIMTLSEEDRAFWSEFNPHTFVTINEVDERFLDQAPASLGGHTVLWVGRISQDKSPLEALRVFALVKRLVSDARLVMAGPYGDIDEATFEATARDLGVRDAVTLLGAVPAERMPQTYGVGDVLLFTSHFEGYPVALAEAKASGLPVAMYDLRWLTLLQGHKGMLVAPLGDVEQLAALVVGLLEDADLRLALGAAAREQMEELARFPFAELWERVFATVAAPATEEADGAAHEAWAAEGSEREAGGLVAELLLEAAEDGRLSREYQAGLEADRDRIRHDLECVTGSASFKAGRALTAPLRLVRDRMH